MNGPQSWTNHGDSISVLASYASASLVDGLTRRDQLLGLLDEETAVPLVNSLDPRFNGYYRVASVDVLTDPFVLVKGNLYDFSLGLERIPGFQAPLIESTLVGGLVANAFSVVIGTTQPWHAVPRSALDYGNTASLGNLWTRTAEDGGVMMVYGNPAAAFYSSRPSFVIQAAGYYQSAAQLQSGLLTASLMPVVGRQAPVSTGDWRITNGLMRVESSATSDGLKLTWFNGTTWGTPHTFKLTMTSGAVLVEEPTIRTMRNTPEEVVVRVSFKQTVLANVGPVFLDVAVRRGARIARCYLTWMINDAFKIAHVGNVACTALTGGGIRATVNDSDGNRFVLMCSQSMTQDLVNGSLLQAAQTHTALDFGIGCEVPGANVVAGDQAQDLVYQYLAGQAESQRVVVR